MVRTALLFIFLSLRWTVYGQEDSLSITQDSIALPGLYFEGKITYQRVELNPNPALISDEDFYESLPNKGKSDIIYYIRGNQYRVEYKDQVEIYVPNIGTVISFTKSGKDSITRFPVHVIEDKIDKVIQSEKKIEILGKSCNSIIVKTKWETKTYFFHDGELKTNPSYWKNHAREFYHLTVAKQGNFPLGIVRESMLGGYVIRATKIEKMKLNDQIFQVSENVSK